MEEEAEQSPTASVPSSSSSDAIEGPSSASQVHEEAEETSQLHQVEDHQHHHRSHQQHHNHHHRPPGLSYGLNLWVSDVASTQLRDDAWPCLIMLVSFWFFAVSMTIILGIYGSVDLLLGPNCSRLIQVNPFFVQSIKAQEIDESKDSKHGPMLYGFYETPPLDTEITWSETHKAFIQSKSYKEWEYFLNKGSKVDISYNVISPSSAPLSLVIAQGRESLVEWIEDPSYPNSTLSWNIIHGNGIIQQEIWWSKMYYIAVGNLNSEEVEVQLNFTIKGSLYNTTQAYYKCSLSHHLCSLTLFLLGTNAAVLSSPATEQGVPYNEWFVKLSYGPRWITYFIGSGTMSAIILLAFRMCNMFQTTRGDGIGFQAGEIGSERAPLLSRKDDDLSSWGSSYDSISHDEEEAEEWLAVASIDGKAAKEGESNSNPQRLCVICFDAPRDCFFLPCGHCAACFVCGTRAVEEAGTCPICRRPMKKVRKIFIV